MVANYPYFGLPRYLNYLNSRKNLYTASPTNSDNTFSKKVSLQNSRKNMPPQRQSVDYKNRNFFNNSNNIYKNTKANFSNNTSNFKQSSETISKKNSIDEASPFFEFMGIKLFFDDILLICLIFFLYNEKVDDMYLLLALVLLLLS